MSNDWHEDKRWSDRFLPEIKAILGGQLIGEPPIEEDAERNTDLIVLKMEAVRIACRIRRYSYYEKYANEFTLRVGRPSGIKTELTKVIEGWGDYFFYGFADEDEKKLAAWRIGDLKKFRLWFNRQLTKNKGIVPGMAKINKDGSSDFIAFAWDFVDGFEIARGRNGYEVISDG